MMMPETTTEERILGEAARWHARLAACDCTDFDRAAFQRWRAMSPRHDAAFAAAEKLSARIGRWADVDERLSSMADDAFALGTGDPERRSQSTRMRRWMVPAALAASVVIAAVAIRISYLQPETAPSASFTSPRHAPRDVTLSDGSLVHLDADSQISVSYSAGHRDVVLVNGRALFEVAHDVTRPFAVTAGKSHTTALGTRFQVQREGERVLVTLADGSIAVTNDAGPSHWREKLSPGEQLSLTLDGRKEMKRVVDARAVTSWVRGRLVFRNTPLREALLEVNRYGTRVVRLGDPELAELPVAGDFIAGETELIVSALAAVMPLRVVEGSTGEIILFRRYEADYP